MLNLLLAIPLSLLAIALVLFLSSVLYASISGPLEGFLERQRFARYAARARECDELIKQGDRQRALRALQAAFYLPVVRNRDLSSAVANHHTALLSRAIVLTSEAQEGSVRLLSLAKVDRLLSERSQLQKRYFTIMSGNEPTRRREVEAALSTNAGELTAALQQLVTEVAAVQRPALLH